MASAFGALLLIGIAASLLVGWRRHRLGPAIAGCAAGLIAIFVAAGLAINTDYRDADGFTDCWPSCTRFQEAVGAAFWYTPALLVLVGIVFVVLVAVTERRRRAARPRG
jgi:hypothetical protein